MTGIAGKLRIVLRLLFGLLFLGAGTAKIVGAPMMVQEFGLFADYGIGQWFRYFTGAVEIIGALMLIRPRTTFPGAALLTVVCIGATVAQIAVIHQDWIHGVVMGALIAWTGWGYRSVART